LLAKATVAEANPYCNHSPWTSLRIKIDEAMQDRAPAITTTKNQAKSNKALNTCRAVGHVAISLKKDEFTSQEAPCKRDKERIDERDAMVYMRK
jgi:hypothetical protein